MKAESKFRIELLERIEEAERKHAYQVSRFKKRWGDEFMGGKAPLPCLLISVRPDLAIIAQKMMSSNNTIYGYRAIASKNQVEPIKIIHR